MENEVKINFNPEGTSGTLLIGKALTPKEPQKLSISGNFQTVSRYIVSKKSGANTFQEIDPKSAIITCDEANLSITLETNPNCCYGTTVKAKAVLSKELELFGINQNKFFNREQLIKLLRFNRRFFPNKEENAKLLLAYQKFSASVSKNINAESDQRGNRMNLSDKTVKTDLPECFVIALPIFENGDSVSFPVEICLEENDSGIRFWFESVELMELIEVKTKDMFERELSYFEDVVVIFK